MKNNSRKGSAGDRYDAGRIKASASIMIPAITEKIRRFLRNLM
jgi:hypothetical protein